jgi:hypothetical protein
MMIVAFLWIHSPGFVAHCAPMCLIWFIWPFIPGGILTNQPSIFISELPLLNLFLLGTGFSTALIILYFLLKPVEFCHLSAAPFFQCLWHFPYVRWPNGWRQFG